jgi:tRNA (guanine37-N1)-methyltransferase
MPDIISAAFHGVLGHAIEKDIITLNIVKLREFSERGDGRIDDRPYGGGPGMVIKAEVVYQALQSLGKNQTIELSPQGKRLDRQKLQDLAKLPEITLICGRYEGIDQRVDSYIDQKISIGDYVLTGGEIPALVLIDALSRFLPGCINADSVSEDSFENGLLDHPHYTKPATWQKKSVNPTLLSGHHNKISSYRLMKSIGNTWLNRPDLLINKKFSENELALWIKFVQNHDRRGEDYE